MNTRVKRNIEMYRDIIDLPHHVSKKHEPMSMEMRAAQFSPFAALTGHEEAIEETARLTKEKRELSEYEKSVLDEKFQTLLQNQGSSKVFGFLYYVEDEFKDGGEYIPIKGSIKTIDSVNGKIVLKDLTTLKITNIYDIKEMEN